MQGADPFDEVEFFSAIARSGARALLIGRRALIALGIPVLTADYDFWVSMDDIAAFNAALAPLGFTPNRPPEQVKQFGRYRMEDGETLDVLAARQAATFDGQPVRFDDLWARRRPVEYTQGVTIFVPAVADLILTKRFGTRARDRDDIRLLEALLFKEGKQP